MNGGEDIPVGSGGRVRELEALVRRHQELYYNAEPELADAEFDRLWDELRTLAPSSPVLAEVGADRLDGWPKAPHLIPMGSQNKASSPGEFLEWAARTALPGYIVQYKLDGASIELQYRHGRFVRAVTRGDGTVGDDISPNARRMHGFVEILPEPFSGGVRGEILMYRAALAERYPDKANCRNAANGLMKRKDGRGAEDLRIVCYDAMRVDGGDETKGSEPFSDEAGKTDWLSRMGFDVARTERIADAAGVVEYRNAVMAARPSLEYDIDGLVVKSPDIDGADAERPRPERQIAFKFSPEEAVSTLVGVEWSQSGGTFTPIGIIEAVRLAGTDVRRANLCNTNMLRDLDLRLGSRIVVTKRGEIIPKIEALVENPPGAAEIPVPGSCSCGSALVDEGTRLYCPNPRCPGRGQHRLEKWLSVLGVMEFGPALLERLYNSGRVAEISDLYSLAQSDLESLDRMGPVLARKILRNLAAKREVTLAVFVAGLDIEGVGELIVEKAIAAGFDTLTALRRAKVEDLDGTFGIARKTAQTIVDGLAALAPVIDRILATGAVSIVEGKKRGRLAGIAFCFTGELVSLKRSEAEVRVKALGGTVRSSVTKDLGYLVTNDVSSGTGKNRKAAELGVPVIDESAFLELVDGGGV